jgi:ATP-dependent DNA helicase RecG
MTKQPINISVLLSQQKVVDDGVEYKTGWNPDAIILNVYAFANDFRNYVEKEIL